MGHDDLSYFRDLLSRMLDDLTRTNAAGVGVMADEREAPADPADRATQEADRDLSLIMRERDRRLLREIREALARLDRGEYGQCEECGEDIPMPRLKARPMSTLCVSCKQSLEEGRLLDREYEAVEVF